MSNEILTYDKNTDLLAVYKHGETVQTSLQLGDLNIEFNTDNQVVGIELLNASETVFSLQEDTDPATLLKEVQEASLTTDYRRNGIVITLQLYLDKEKQQKAAILTETAPAV